ncbi:phosphoribosylaminoimidazolecarboxamide formyltransferase [Helicobacter kayseriensis]|uniref:phosphoribosylaminoimidazolecarboxamide formyltransferase n=1 Tax=Helicobacter kayseriensis TaxID=2905877 RepID=UPI001E46C3F4|nr:phosphoribosylaminoimidazolecarboxamide formyltransferase [Helicobacter kayseriensis]MCE3047128.1 phosphoribosylaminoimidazolecarboxamide formyltransferase [Helicobacter kayseriensis]MCE3048499.1 phosphoribosylaminoimidazolecarboxamide formyltransferase [Helicobacter kayseriensis]
MQEIKLKYGCNPNQTHARIFSQTELPIKVLNGSPSYINFLDALNAWQLVKELKEATKLPCATSFKHLSPTSSALANPLPDSLIKALFLQECKDLNSSPIATAYARARGADRMSSFGDFIALSDPCDEITAYLIAQEVSDGIIAPSFSPQALEILKQKRQGTYNIFQIDEHYTPHSLERREVFGITFEQQRNEIQINESLLADIVTQNKTLPPQAKTDLILALITLKYTQSNSICFAYDSQAIGVGAGQQSRIHCTKIAGDKADFWNLRQHPKVLALPFIDSLKRPTKDNLVYQYIHNELPSQWDQFFTMRPEPFLKEEQEQYLQSIQGVSLGSDAFFPFADNILRAVRSGVSYIAQSGGSKQDQAVIEACNEHNLTMIFTHTRLFHH